MRFAAVFACMLATGCPASPSEVDAGPSPMDAGGGVDTGMPPGEDAGTPPLDTGTPPPDCGEVGQACCASGARCVTGASCGDDGACCANPGGGAACGDPSDCCGENDCVGGKCCALQMGSCRSSADCCTDLLCADGLCLRPFEECGREGQACCAGDACRSGLECAGGRCEPCGADGQRCCLPPSECTGALSCREGRCGAPDPTCGGDGQPCCEGTRCEGTLTCASGRCAPPATACAYLDCAECTRHYPCGWCDGVGCREGTSSGPSGASCASSWAWLGSQCPGAPDPCASSTDCASCTARAGCGYCGDGAGACRSGTGAGPSAGTCGDWSWVSSECGGAGTCARHTTCDACTGEYPCGFCGATGACTEGSASGPDSGSCPSWAWLRSECVAPDPCAAETACGACTARSGCGWCESDRTCRGGTAGGPTTGSCGDWDFGASSCTCSMVQGSCTTASDCCGGLSCRQGVTFGVRCCAEATQPCAVGGDCCGYMDCNATTRQCTCRTAGRGCLENADCCSRVCSAGRCT
ncbi:MAG: hypothetical protein KF729_27465 [Sandaracinaceae bacterium]|nr:hypothetical protein [Sandaracinaceae bacterium]